MLELKKSRKEPGVVNRYNTMEADTILKHVRTRKSVRVGMKRLVFSVLAAVLVMANADGFENACNKLTGNSNPEDIKESDTSSNTQNITKTCFVVIFPEDFRSESGDFEYYLGETWELLKKMGIEGVFAEKRYLSFALSNGTQYIIDTKEAEDDPYGKSMLLYKKGKKPMNVDFVTPDMESIKRYLK